MRLKSRLRKLEQAAAPAVPPCDCPVTMHYQMADGTVYPPEVPCLRGRCPEASRSRGVRPPVRSITIRCAVPSEEEPEPGFPMSVDEFRVWDPETGTSRLRVIVCRDEAGRMRYHGPPRWYEIEGIEEPRVVRGVGVIEEIVEELRCTDVTSALIELTADASNFPVED